MKPILEALADGNPHPRGQLVDQLARRFQLTAEEEALLTPSGKSPLFFTRISWAVAYLKKAGLIATPRRGFYQITKRGKEVLGQDPEPLDKNFLMRFEEFRTFIEQSRAGSASAMPEGETPTASPTPTETLERAYQELRAAVISELMERIREIPPVAFERLVVDVLVKVGYGGMNEDAGVVVGGPGDEGIDGVIRLDPLGLEHIYLQVKKWDQAVGRPEVQKFVGALQGKRARKGIFVTSSEFTKEAREYVAHLDVRVVLIDGKKLAELMFDYGIGVAVVSQYQVKRIDSDYFDELMGQL
ncbi:restriction endonuclease [Thermus albus]|uniref:restriction endonuclease n=1 Tax=Thermus albus TaxID=2908146 RepID=UPI001FA9F5F2|nr:restriction endonuclease [Thermus albus]